MIELRPHQLEALDAMNDSDKGQIIVPTGGGKTMCMIEDVKRQFKSPVSKTIVVVAPRILLANQLCSEFLEQNLDCLLYTSPSPRDRSLSRMPSSA